MFAKKTVRDIDVRGKKAVVRAMLNVPIHDGLVGDRLRLKEAIPTLRYLLDQDAAIILVSHHSTEGQSLAPVAPVLAELLGVEVAFVPESVGEAVEKAVAALEPGHVLMLENLRFHPEEEANDESFARTLAGYGDFYVNDDFTACHRPHASLVGIPRFLPAVAGYGVEREVTTITEALERPKRPLVAISGGAKISTKVPIISNLLPRVDALLIGGAMANTFLAAMGKEVGKSLVEKDQYGTAKQIVADAEKHKKRLLLPTDVVVTTDLRAKTDIRTVSIDAVGKDDIIADIGPESVAQLQEVIKPEGTVIWNGPVGIAEDKEFAAGTRIVASTIIASGAYSVVGGGDTADYIDRAGLGSKFGFVSTGGGASLELMAGNKLPGVEALQDK